MILTLSKKSVRIRNFAFALFTSLILVTSFAVAQQRGAQFDRRDLIEASFSVLCPSLKVVRQNAKVHGLDSSDQSYLNDLIQVCERAKLQFLENFSGYTFPETSQERWMGTDEKNPSSPIYVSLSGVNAEDRFGTELKAISFVHTVLLHELGRKIPGLALAEKDRFARFFADKLSQFELPRVILPDGELFIFSIPSEQADFEIQVKEGEELQPTFAVVQNHQGRFLDLTKSFSTKVSAEGPRLRSLWTEMNALVLKIISIALLQIQAKVPQMNADIDAQFDRIREEMLRKLEQVDEPKLREMKNQIRSFMALALSPSFKELRMLNIVNAQVLEQEGQAAKLQIKATYVLDRSFMDSFKNPPPGWNIDVSGIPELAQPVLELPILIDVPFNKTGMLDTSQIHLQLRPNLNLSKSAKLGRIQSAADKTLVRVSLSGYSGQPPEVTQLRLNYPGGHIMIPALRTEWIGSSSLSFLFEVPESVGAIPYDLEGDSILLNQRNSYLLDKLALIPRRNSQGFILVPNERPQILPGSFGILADNGESPAWIREFHSLKPLFVISKGWENLLREKSKTLPQAKGDEEEARWVFHDRVPIELSYRGPEKIRELRVELMRVLIAGEVNRKDGKDAITGKVQWGDKVISTSTSIENTQTETIREFVSISGSSLQIQSLRSGDKKVQAEFALDAVQISKPLQQGEDHYAPISLVLTQVELVFEDGSSVVEKMDILRFDPGSCEMVFK